MVGRDAHAVRATLGAGFASRLHFYADSLASIDPDGAGTDKARRYGPLRVPSAAGQACPRGAGCYDRHGTHAHPRQLRALAHRRVDVGEGLPHLRGHVLAHALQSGDTIVMDDLPGHRVSGTSKCIEAQEAWRGGIAPGCLDGFLPALAAA